MDPDLQVQTVLRAFFATFRRVGSATATVRSFRERELLFPRRWRTGPHKGELCWAPLDNSHVLDTLHNPRYAGAFAYGRTQLRKTADGRTSAVNLPREQWHTLIADAHPGYISWAEFEDNQRRLRENAQAQGEDRRKSPPREGPALLQGLVICGRCGGRMTVGYLQRGSELLPEYRCSSASIQQARRMCQRVPGHGLDRAIGELLVETVTPLALEVALSVQEELELRAEEADRLRRQQVERARYEAELAQRRFLRVDPDHRLVADSLEAEWNHKLRALAAAQEDYERQREADRPLLDEEKRAQILTLATDFPRLWRDPATPVRERKRMVRLILEDVTLLRQEQIVAHVRFRAGATRTLSVPVPPKIWQTWQTPRAVVQEVDRLLEYHHEAEVAAILNARGLRPGRATRYNWYSIFSIRQHYGLTDHFTRLRQRGLLTEAEAAALLNVSGQTVRRWRSAGKLVGHQFNAKGECLYEAPGENPPVKWAFQRSPRPNRALLPLDPGKEVQSDA